MDRLYRLKKTLATVAGSLSFNTHEIRGDVRLLSIKPTTVTTRYTVTITNDDNVVVYKTTVDGTLLDESVKYWYGIYTIAISGATADENFDFTIQYVDLQ